MRGAKPDLAFGAVDMAQAGGGEMGPSNAKFYPDIQMDLDAKGCTIAACHGTAGDGSVMTVKMGATVQADIDANYMSVDQRGQPDGAGSVAAPAQSARRIGLRARRHHSVRQHERPDLREVARLDPGRAPKQ